MSVKIGSEVAAALNFECLLLGIVLPTVTWNQTITALAVICAQTSGRTLLEKEGCFCSVKGSSAYGPEFCFSNKSFIFLLNPDYFKY